MAVIDIKHLHIGGNPAKYREQAEKDMDDMHISPRRRGTVTMLIGGERSGKTRYAEDYAIEAANDGGRYFIATAQNVDDETSKRILAHKAEREGHFVTIEEPVDLPKAVRELPDTTEICIVDCLTVWVENLIASGADVEKKIQELYEVLFNVTCHVILVTNETGWANPTTPEEHRFIDITGKMHQNIATLSDNVLVMIAGIPFALKGHVL